MKAQHNFILIAVCMAMYGKVTAQDVSLSFGQASDNKFTQSEPGKFTATFPAGSTAKKSYAANGYLALNLGWGATTVSITGELQKNTLIEKVQDVQQYGLKIAQTVPFSGTLSDPNFAMYVDVSGKYSKDRVEDKKGMQWILAMSLDYANAIEGWTNYLRPNAIFPEGKKKFSDVLQYRWTNSFGIDHIAYEELTMGNITFGIELFPLSGLLYKAFDKYDLIQLKWSIVDRFKLGSSTSTLYTGTLKTYGAGLNFMFDEDGTNAITVGYEHVDGGNPMKGLADQKYGQLAFGAKVKF